MRHFLKKNVDIKNKINRKEKENSKNEILKKNDKKPCNRGIKNSFVH